MRQYRKRRKKKEERSDEYKTMQNESNKPTEEREERKREEHKSKREERNGEERNGIMNSLVRKVEGEVLTWGVKEALLLSIIVISFIFTISLAIVLKDLAVSYREVASVYKTVNEHSNNRGSDKNILEMIDEIHGIYDKYYIGEDASLEDIEDGVLAGYASAFNDQYGFYMSPEETDEFVETQDAMLLGGIGIQTRFEYDMETFSDGETKYKYSYYIINVYPDTPAEKVGIQKGDRLVQVNDVALTYTNSDDFLEEVRGEAGTEVSVKLIRDNKLMDLKLIRDNVKSKSINTNVLRESSDGKLEALSLSEAYPSDIGYIKISSFTNETDEEYTQALNEIANKGIDKYIIDVRDNSGGIVESVVAMLDTMVPEGTIAELKYKDASQNVKYTSDENETKGKFIVLVNERSASASELFSKTLQEYGKAIIIGKQTYGKGTVIQTLGLSNGGSITLSTGEYYTSKGENLENTGVEPDIEVSIPYETELYLYKLPLSSDTQLVRAFEEVQK